MALRNAALNRLLARKIRETLGDRITEACERSSVPASFLSGLISVENAQLKPGATRFEPHVFEALRKVRDGERPSYNGIKRAHIDDASEAALKALATSYGYTQIMGWWSLYLECTVADLRDPDKHLGLAVRLLERVAGAYLKKRDWVSAYKIWNTGKPDGKTHDPDYVANAQEVRVQYQKLENPTTGIVHHGLASEPLELEGEDGGVPSDPPKAQFDASTVIELPPSAPDKSGAKKSLWGTITAGVAGLGITGAGISQGIGAVTANRPMLAFIVLIGAVVFMVAYWKYQDRQTKLDMQREEQAFELTKLQALIAANPEKYNVKIVSTK